ncbi:MAG TPA: hypothetical protein VFJ29_03045 [Candidatus Kapabacteria bacterium]|nr:hypothetical protein [Candidatus Kapabacteria bacterium]
MQQRWIFLIIVIFSLMFGGTARAEGWTQPEGKVEFIPSLFYYSAAREFSSDGLLYDFSNSGSLTAVILTLYGEWGVTNDLTLIGEVPFAHFEYQESDSAGSFRDVLTPPFTYIGVGGRYALWRIGNTVVSVSNMVHVPPGFHRGLYDDPTHPFLSDGYFENISAAEFGASFTWGWLEGKIAYHARDEDPSNQLELQCTAGFSSQKNIMAKVTLGYIKTLAPLPATAVNPRLTNAQENYLWLETQFIIKFSGFSVGAGFNFRVVGQHTLDMDGGGITFIL